MILYMKIVLQCKFKLLHREQYSNIYKPVINSRLREHQIYAVIIDANAILVHSTQIGNI